MTCLRLLCLAVFSPGFALAAAKEAHAWKIVVNDARIEYIKYSPDAIEIKLTRFSIGYAMAFMNARKVVQRVNAYQLWFMRSHVNPINITWRESDDQYLRWRGKRPASAAWPVSCIIK